jgi:hypothetical protein
MDEAQLCAKPICIPCDARVFSASREVISQVFGKISRTKMRIAGIDDETAKSKSFVSEVK